MNHTNDWRLMFDTIPHSCSLIITKKISFHNLKKIVWSPLRDMWEKANIQ